MATDSLPVRGAPTKNSNVRFSRMLSIPQLTAVGLSVSIGIGVYSILGDFLQHVSSASIQASFLLLALLAVPILLTLADAAAMARSGGAYGLVRGQRWLLLPFLTGWMLVGGYTTLLALLATGLGQHAYIMLASVDLYFEPFLLALVILLLFAVLKIVSGSLSWQRRVLISFGATLIALTIAGAGLFFDPSARNLQLFLQRDALAVDVSITTTMTLFGASLWGLVMIIESRSSRHNPIRLRRAMLATVLLLTLVAGTSALAVERHIGPLENPATPLLTFASEGMVPSPLLLRMIYLIFGTLLLLMALDIVYTNAIRLVEYMTADGFVPLRIEQRQGRSGVPLLPVIGTTALALLIMRFDDTITLLALSSVLFFWTVAALNLPGVVAGPGSGYGRRTKLPFHPLFPGFVIAVGLFLPVTLAGRSLLLAAGWSGLGLLSYFAYARRSGTARRRSNVIDSDDVTNLPGAALAEKSTSSAGSAAARDAEAVLVALTNAKNSDSLISLGARLAKVRAAGLIVLRVIHVPEQTAFELRRKLVEREIESLRTMLAEIETFDVPIRPVVRLGISPLDGILDVMESESVDLLLLGWSGTMETEEIPADLLIDRLMRAAPCDVLVLRGVAPETPERTVVATAGGPHSILATQLASTLYEGEEHHLRLLHVLPEESTTDEKKVGSAAFDACVSSLEDNSVEQEMVAAASIEEGIIAGAEEADLLILGAARENAFMRSRFRGMPVKIATNIALPVIIVRAEEEVQHPFVVRTWELISDPLPTLTEARRKEVRTQMEDAAAPSIDFFVLIVLASIIATLGLLQNSAAVIIGAMLVAPLMSPILAMAMALVRGDLAMLATAGEATVKGIFLAIAVGVVVALISPINTPTNEILARTQPNVLDLMVALASGAAAGYAISRSQVAAALPGVAIAAALVPPLGVVGYGISTSQLDFAGGALLLFITNFVAIVLAAALVYIALGFYPRNTGQEELLHRLRLPVISLVAISIILVIATIATVRDANVRNGIEEILTEEITGRGGEIQSLVITRQADRYAVAATLIVTQFDEWTPDAVARLEAEVETAVGRPTDINAFVMSGQHYTEESYHTYAIATSYVEYQVEARGGQIMNQYVYEDDTGVIVDATIVDLTDGQLDSSAMESIRRGLQQELDRPVHLNATLLKGDYTSLEPAADE